MENTERTKIIIAIKQGQATIKQIDLAELPPPVQRAILEHLGNPAPPRRSDDPRQTRPL